MIGINRRKKKIRNLLTDLQNAPRKTRFNAVAELGSMCAEEAVPELLRMLNSDESSLVRTRVLFALNEIGDTDVIPVLIDFIKEEKDHLLRVFAIWVLGEFGEYAKDAVAILLDRLKNDPYEKARGWAARSLANIGAEEAIPDLIERLYETDLEVAWRAAYALGLMHADRAIEPLKERLKDITDEKAEFHFATAIDRIEAKMGMESETKKVIEKMKEKGGIAIWIIRNFEERLSKEFNLVETIKELREGTELLGQTLKKQASSPEKDDLLIYVNIQQKMLENIVENTKPRTWWRKFSSEIISAVVGFVISFIITLIFGGFIQII